MKIKGRNAVREALKTDVNILKIMASSNSKDRVLLDILSLARAKGVKVQMVESRVLDRECENNQGIVAITSEFEYSTVEDILNVAREKGRPNFILILCYKRPQKTSPVRLRARSSQSKRLIFILITHIIIYYLSRFVNMQLFYVKDKAYKSCGDNTA